MNIAKLPKEEQERIYQDLVKCRHAYYRNMSRIRAVKILGGLEDWKKKEFKKRVNEHQRATII